jgi:ADP-heptose:LPS heptosyltransferase
LIQLKRVGDVLLCTPLARALRADRADRRILFLTEVSNREVLRGNQTIDAVLTVPDPMRPRDWWGIVPRLRAESIDTVIDCSGTPRSCLLTALSGAPVRIGFRVRLPRRSAYNRIVVPDRSKYTVDRRLDLLRSLGIEDRGFDPELVLDADDREEANALLTAAGFPSMANLIAIAPTSRKPKKRWSPDGFARVATWARDRLGLEILLLCGYGEEEQEEEVRSRIVGGARRLPEIPRLRVLAALIERSRILLTNDGGPKHLAVALKTPTVTLFVSTAPSSWHPPGADDHVAVAGREDVAAEVEEVCEALRTLVAIP